MAGQATGSAGKALVMPFQEAIDYQQQKQPRTSSHWTEYLDEAHARSFVVAGAAKQAIVDDFKAAIDKAISQGTGFNEFRGDFEDIVKKHGWQHTGMPGWRAKIIYQTNMANAYAAGRYAQQTDPDVLAAFPYWEYLHVNCAHPRPQHVAWSGMVLRADDPWWNTNYPPNGWNCHCIVGLVNDRGLAARGMSAPNKAPPLDWREYVNRTTGVVSKYPAGVDPGFAYNPGKVWKDGGTQPVTAPDVRAVERPTIPLPKTQRFDTPEKADEVLKAAMMPWAEKLSPAENDALADYKGRLGRPMNEAARGDGPPALKMQAKILEAALDRAKMPMSVAAWRAIGPEEARLYTRTAIGETVVTDAFVSTTIDQAHAQALAKGENLAVIKIIVPAGTRGAAYVHPFPSYRFRQYEVLLNIGTKLRIVRNDGTQLVLIAGEVDDAEK